MDAGLSESIKPWTLSWLERGCSVLRMHETMDVIMPPTWMLSCQIASDHGSHPGRAQNAIQHGRYHCPPPRMLPCQIAADHGRYDGWALIALCSECNIPWTLSCPPPPHPLHGCSCVRMHQTMDVIMFGPWMFWAQNTLDHGRHGSSQNALDHVSIMVWPWMLSSHHPSTPVSDMRLLFLIRTGF